MHADDLFRPFRGGGDFSQGHGWVFEARMTMECNRIQFRKALQIFRFSIMASMMKSQSAKSSLYGFLYSFQNGLCFVFGQFSFLMEPAISFSIEQHRPSTNFISISQRKTFMPR
jgi:hypothetical protein